ncbi:MAG: hypothetical protein AAGI15_00665 [Pseudomonadota bacterium]
MPWPALLRREWLEHRMALLWAPLLLALALIGLALTASTLDLGRMAAEARQDDDPLHLLSALAFVSLPFVLLYLLTATFVLLGALFDERQDRSIVFFKSLPVTDLQTVASKLIAVLLLAPLVTVVAITVTQFAAVLFLTLNCDCGAGVLGNLAEAQLLGNLPLHLFGFVTQALWSLPVWSWLLLVSAIAPRLPMLLALGGPALLAFSEWLVLDRTAMTGALAVYLEPVGLQPYQQLVAAGETGPVTWAMAVDPWLRRELWLGLVLSAMLLAATVIARRHHRDL